MTVGTYNPAALRLGDVVECNECGCAYRVQLMDPVMNDGYNWRLALLRGGQPCPGDREPGHAMWHMIRERDGRTVWPNNWIRTIPERKWTWLRNLRPSGR